MIVFLWRYSLPPGLRKKLQSQGQRNVLVVGWLCDCIEISEPVAEHCLDHVFYFDSWLRNQLLRRYPAGRIGYLPLAASPERYFPDGMRGDPRLLFAGTVTAERAEILRGLEALGVSVRVCGPRHCGGWAGLLGRRLSARKLRGLYSRYRAVVNISQEENTKCGLNFRAFEVTAAGGLLLTPPQKDLPECFEANQEVLTYRRSEEIPEILERISICPAWAGEVAAKGRARLLQSHTFVNRASAMAALLPCEDSDGSE